MSKPSTSEVSVPSKSRDKSPYKLDVGEDSPVIRELIKKRGICKGRLTKFSNFLASFEDDTLSSQKRIDLKLRIQGATTLFSEFNDIQGKIEELVSDVDEQLTQRDMFENTYYTILSQAECLVSKSEVTDSSSKCNHHKKTVKLPTISMPTFDGSYEQWLEFRDTFLSLVHKSDDLSNIEKFHYLKSALKGSAELVINSVEFCSDNYPVAWDLLLNRYNNSRLLVHNHVKSLFTMQCVGRESPVLIRRLIDTVLKNLRALNILGEPSDSWDTLVIYLVVSKLDQVTEREWEQHKVLLFRHEHKRLQHAASQALLYNIRESHWPVGGRNLAKRIVHECVTCTRFRAPATEQLSDVPAHRLTRYQRLEQIRQHFWVRWSREYISEMQTRVKWRQDGRDLQPNTMVVIKEDNTPPLKWSLGRIISTMPGKDGISRVADIQTKSGVIRRAFPRICPLFNEEGDA